MNWGLGEFVIGDFKSPISKSQIPNSDHFLIISLVFTLNVRKFL
jgi:hypothetical protein